MREKQSHFEEFWTQPESRRLEFKEQFPGGKQLAKTSVAFSNGGGGKIVFGVRNDPCEIVGDSFHRKARNGKIGNQKPCPGAYLQES